MAKVMFSVLSVCQPFCSQGGRGCLALAPCLYRDPLDIFKLVHYQAWTVRKWVVGIRLKCLLLVSVWRHVPFAFNRSELGLIHGRRNANTSFSIPNSWVVPCFPYLPTLMSAIIGPNSLQFSAIWANNMEIHSLRNRSGVACKSIIDSIERMYSSSILRNFHFIIRQVEPWST